MSRLFNDASSEFAEIIAAAVTAVPLSMACWFYTDDAGASQSLMSIQDSSVSDHWLASLYARGNVAGDPVEVFSRAGSLRTATTTTGYSVNTWHHACGVWASTTSRSAYIDGGSKGTNTDTSTPSGIDSTSIGRAGDSSPSSYMSGRIAHAAIWNVALTDDEVASLGPGKLSPLLVRPGSLVGYWRMRGDHSPELDETGVTGNLTLTGSVKAEDPPIILPSPPFIITAPAAVGGGADVRNHIIPAYMRLSA